ncbi:carcinoembryonic antigen-related cell adhesion molecule 5-like [Salvelinus namaycush]|uniref:Carcinoembryonic antigen-related cell adhesion molecule 5-like n=1 Tax=Salvelinus namaycush TaxID=8040 RepID=A0A8U0QXR6_SALNM|nr:carcinoembryonic antigen-related cell adhesion molecule 5-like [Salvelinus namaycush]
MHIYDGKGIFQVSKGKAKAVLTIYPTSSQIFSGESVTLRCNIQRGEVTDWEYTWRKDVVDTINRNHEYEISEVKISDNGDYRCLGKHIDQKKHSEWSDAVRLTVTALPETTLTVNPDPAYNGETVTLTCSVGSDSGWSFTWYKDQKKKVVTLSGKHTTTGATFTISRAAESDQGLYWCQGEIQSRSISSIISDPVTITVKSLPTASVKASPRGPLYSGETVTLQCDISDYRDWTYRWHRDNHLLPIPTSKTTTISLPDQAGQYQCEGTRTRRPERTYLSSSLTIVVAALPKATLTITPNPAYTGETVTLTCSVGSDSGWRYTWYKDNSKKVVTLSGRHTITVFTFTLKRAAESDQGLYWCQGEIQSRPISSIISDPVTITVKERPVAVLTLQPNWPQIFSGETVTLSCDIQGGEEIEYVFYNSGKSVYTKTEPEYRISPAKNGLYTCEGLQKRNGLKHSQTSNAIQLTVLDKPQAVLSVSPQWLNPGDSVTLSCGVKESSTGWRFFWYRTVPYTAGLLSLSDTSYSVELLSGNVTSEDSYTLIPAGPSHTGGYVCRAGRGDPVYDTLYSEPQFLWSGDLQPSVSLKIRPNRIQHFTSKSLSLSCEEKRNSTGWRLKRYREKAGESECGSNWGSIAGSTCTISSIRKKDSGVYWCESGSGEYSNAVNITVDVGTLILESPPYPITEGDSVTLSCTNRYQETNPNPKVDFYKDGVLIRNETTLEMTIPAVSKSDEGFYKCKSNEGESPESWVTVRGVTPGPSTSALVGVVVGLVVAGVLLAILLVLLCRYKKAGGPPSPRGPTWTPNRTKDLPRARLLMLGIHVCSMMLVLLLLDQVM